MSQAQPFVIPAEVVFQIDNDGIVIENRGDIVLHTSFGRPLKRVISTEGSIHLHAPAQAILLQAAGDVLVAGGVAAEAIQAGGSIRLAGDLQAARIEAGGALEIQGNAQLGAVHTGGDVLVSGGISASELRAAGNFQAAGDVIVQRIEVGGSVQIGGGVSSTSAQAGGDFGVNGNAQLGTVHAGNIRLLGGSVVARGLRGWSAVQFAAGRVQIDAVVAAEIQFDPRTSGRITLLEIENEAGPNGVKGCFSMADYAEMFGDAHGFLRERSIDPDSVKARPAPTAVSAPEIRISAPSFSSSSPIMALPSSPPIAAPVIAVAPMAVPVAAPVIPAAPPVQVAPAVPVVEAAPEPVAPPVAAPIIDEPMEVPVHELEPITEPPKEHTLHPQLVDAVSKVVDAYTDGEVPPAVEKLRGLVQEKAYDRVRGEITQIWSELLKFHQRKGMRLPHQVTPTFNTINSLVKKM